MASDQKRFERSAAVELLEQFERASVSNLISLNQHLPLIRPGARGARRLACRAAGLIGQ
jgi:hypothetical protein